MIINKLSREKIFKKNNTASNLAYITTLIIIASVIFLFFHEIPRENKDLISQIINTLCNVWIGVMAYYNGSSLGSRLKDKYRRNEDKGNNLNEETDSSK